MQAQRPLSPHLQIYRWYLTMALSIFHRASGCALAAGLVLLTWWLVALAAGPDSFAIVKAVTGSIVGGLILFGFTAAIWFHCLNGIRHLVWDTGYGYEPRIAQQSAMAVLIGTAVLTVLTWIIVLIVA